MKEPLVSVIVPVYNVEDFVKTSLESIMNQSYRKIEIICINDGSTDSSADIIQELAVRDLRISMISQENKGLSAARNTGLENCIGEYIVFVDSDDVLHPEFIQILMAHVHDKKVKLSMCAYKKVKDLNIDFSSLSYEKVEIIDVETALKRMLLGEWWSACMKMYHSSIFNTLRFPEGRTNEDYAIMVQIIEQCPEIVYTHAELYFYLTRPNSITTALLNPTNFDEVQNAIDVLAYVKTKHPKLHREAEFNLGASLMKLILETDLDKSKSFLCNNEEMLGFLRANYSSLKRNPYFTFKQKVIMFVQRYARYNFRLVLSRLYFKYKAYQL